MKQGLAVAVLCNLLVACGPGNNLNGSIGEEYDITFDRVEIIKQGDDLLVEYVKESATTSGVDKNCKLIIPKALELGVRDDTRLEGDNFLDSVTIERVSRDRAKFPPVTSGSVDIKKFDFSNNGEVSGEFEAVFESGRTLSGEFNGVVDEVSLDG